MVDPHIRPLGNRVLVKRTPTPDESQGGIYVLGREVPAHGTILAVGPGPRARATGVRSPIDDLVVGDEVTFDKWAADARTFEGDLLILDYTELFLRLRK